MSWAIETTGCTWWSQGLLPGMALARLEGLEIQFGLRSVSLRLSKIRPNRSQELYSQWPPLVNNYSFKSFIRDGPKIPNLIQAINLYSLEKYKNKPSGLRLLLGL